MFERKTINKITKINKPITIEKYIKLCLYSKDGYYNNSKIIGKAGDFITAPEISQLFGEIIGLFFLSFWKNKINKPFNLVELGPGRGTLLIDILNIAKKFSEFEKSITINLIEKNNKLIKEQKNNLVKFNFDFLDINWLDTFNPSDNKPTIIYANEFLDCLPIRQFYKKNNLWYEKMIIFNQTYKCLQFKDAVKTDVKTLKKINNYKHKEVLEISSSREDYFMKICKHINIVGGMIIIIDYGYFDRPNYFTLQSLYNNKKSNVLDNPGLQDITSLIDFNQLIIIAKSNNLKVDMFSSQREFFLSHGIKERAKRIMLKSTQKQKNIIRKGLERLIDKNKMGSLFKVLVVTQSYGN